MAERTLPRLRDLVRQHRYLVSSHAADDLKVTNSTSSTSKASSSRAKASSVQRDRKTGEAKYVIRGITLANAIGCVVAKFDSVGRAVIITVYLE